MSSKYAERFTEICDSCTQKANSLISEYNETLKEYTENLEKIKALITDGGATVQTELPTAPPPKEESTAQAVQ